MLPPSPGNFVATFLTLLLMAFLISWMLKKVTDNFGLGSMGNLSPTVADF